MEAAGYSVVTTAHFDRLLKKLAPKHPDIVERFEEANPLAGPTQQESYIPDQEADKRSRWRGPVPTALGEIPFSL